MNEVKKKGFKRKLLHLIVRLTARYYKHFCKNAFQTAVIDDIFLEVNFLLMPFCEKWW